MCVCVCVCVFYKVCSKNDPAWTHHAQTMTCIEGTHVALFSGVYGKFKGHCGNYLQCSRASPFDKNLSVLDQILIKFWSGSYQFLIKFQLVVESDQVLAIFWSGPDKSLFSGSVSDIWILISILGPDQFLIGHWALPDSALMSTLDPDHDLIRSQ